MTVKLSPDAFADKYLEMQVYIYPPEPKGPDNSALAPPGWQTVRCANYRLSSSATRDPLWSDITSHMPKTSEFKIKTIDGDEVTDTFSQNALWRHFKQSFVGKGSPEQAQIAIQLVYRYHKAKTTLDDFVAKNFIGLDCNGFIGNYFQRVIQGSTTWDNQKNDVDPGPNSWMQDLMSLPGSTGVLKDLTRMDANAGYVLVMADSGSGAVIEPTKAVAATDTTAATPAGYGHIMLTQPGTLTQNKDGSATILVSEATAAGRSELRKDVIYKIYNRRTIGRNVIWTVDRGSSADTLDVQIASFPVP